MLLVEITIAGTVHYISNEALAIERFYEPYIANFGQVRIATRQIYGGFAEASFGQLDILPTPFGTALPAISCPIKISLATTGESDAVEIFRGIARCNEIKRDGIVYDLYGPEHTAEVADYLYSGTLNAVFTTECAVLGLTLNTTYARASSPTVNYKATGTRLRIDNLSDIAAFFAHRFYIIGTTLYLVDCMLDNGAVMALTEFDIFPSSYTYPAPVKNFTAKYPGLTDRYMLTDITVQGGGTNKASFAEISLRRVAGGADLTSTVGGAAFAANFTAPNSPANAVDDNAATFWQSSAAAGSGMHWGFVFTTSLSVQVIEYEITAPPTLNEAPVSWKFQAFDVETGTWRTIKEEEVSNWTAAEVKKFSAPGPTWDVIIAGTHRYGDPAGMDISPVCQTGRLAIEAALQNIKVIMERPRIQINMPITSLPRIGQKVTLTDESLHRPTTIWARVQSIVLNFDNDQCTIEGEGSLS